MKDYTVTCTLQVEAASPEAAAETMLQWMLEPDSLIRVFDVKDDETGEVTTVDLLETDHEDNQNDVQERGDQYPDW